MSYDNANDNDRIDYVDDGGYCVVDDDDDVDVDVDEDTADDDYDVTNTNVIILKTDSNIASYFDHFEREFHVLFHLFAHFIYKT